MNPNTEPVVPSSPSIPFARPQLGPEEEEAVLQVLRSGWLTTGKQCLAFEHDFALRCALPHALAVNSATAGLHLALDALGIQNGDRIAVSPYTFTASCEIMRYLGAHPHFIDIDANSFHMDVDVLARDLERSRRGEIEAIKAIMPVHIGGIGWRMEEVYRLAAEYGIPVVEDAAHAWPARTGSGESETYLGSGGTVGVYSFYANKTITTGEGGMIVCRDPEMAQRMKTMRLHGIDREVWNRFTSKADQWRYAVVAPGYKYNLGDLAASIGVVQLRHADSFMAARRDIARRYNAVFGGIDSLILPPFAHYADDPDRSHHHSWHLYTLRIRPEMFSIDRDEFLRRLTDAGIGISVHYIPLHVMPYYAETYGLKPTDFPRSLEAFESCFSLPIFPGLRDDEVERIVNEVSTLAQQFRKKPR